MAMLVLKRVVLAVLLGASGCASVWAREGVEVGERSVFVDAVSAESVEQQALLQ